MSKTFYIYTANILPYNILDITSAFTTLHLVKMCTKKNLKQIEHNFL